MNDTIVIDNVEGKHYVIDFIYIFILQTAYLIHLIHLDDKRKECFEYLYGLFEREFLPLVEQEKALKKIKKEQCYCY